MEGGEGREGAVTGAGTPWRTRGQSHAWVLEPLLEIISILPRDLASSAAWVAAPRLWRPPRGPPT